MSEKEILQNLCQYAIDKLTYEEYHSFGSPENFHKWVEKHYHAIPKNELEIGKEYNGECRNASKAIWNGEKFTYQRRKFGSTYPEEINHYENDNGYDVFVPIKEVNNEI